MAVAAAVSLCGCGKQTQTPAAPPPTVKVTMAKPVEKEIVDFAELTGNTAAVHSQSVLLVSPRAEPARLVEMEGPQATILTDSLSPAADLALYANPFTMECR